MVRDGVTVIEDVRDAPKYRPLLRPIGAYLDTLQATNLMLVEYEEGFMWRCFAREDPSRLLFGVIGHNDVPQLAETMKSNRLGRVSDLVDDQPIDAVCPYGYEELLRCLSYKLDKEAATTVLVIEDDSSVLVQFTLQVPVYVQMEPERLISAHYFHEDLLMRSDVEALVKQVSEFRGSRFYR
jgi:hypothetical protein